MLSAETRIHNADLRYKGRKLDFLFGHKGTSPFWLDMATGPLADARGSDSREVHSQATEQDITSKTRAAKPGDTSFRPRKAGVPAKDPGNAIPGYMLDQAAFGVLGFPRQGADW